MRSKSPHRVSYLSLVTMACMMACSAVGARAGNIFDDDWTPPKPTGQPHAAPAQPSPTAPIPAPPGPARPASDPAVAPPAVPPPTPEAQPQPHVRHPIPGKLEQARSRGLLKEAFAGKLKDKSSAGRRKLAQALLDEVPKSSDNISDEYVLLGGAIEASKDAGALALCSQAADVMASQYEVDGLSIKTDAALKMDLRGNSPTTAAENVRAALELADSLLAVEDFSTAAKILATARRAAATDAALASTVQKRMQVVESLRAAHDRLEVSLKKLEASPEDPAANLAVGSYLCFNRGDWEKGLGLLARGSDQNLKQVAILELARPKTADDVIRLADRWWDVGAKQPDATRAEIYQHAAAFYKVALPSVTGLRRTLLEQRIADASVDQITERHAESVDLLKIVGANVRIKSGTWKTGEEGLECPEGANRLLVPYAPPEEYDLRVVFTRKGAKETVWVSFPLPHGSLQWVAGGWGNTNTGFANVMSNGAIHLITRDDHPLHDALANGTPYTCIIKVRRGSVEAFLNGQSKSQLKTDGAGYAAGETAINGVPVIEIGAISAATISAIEITEIAGHGHLVK